jgi:hypothetical protein
VSSNRAHMSEIGRRGAEARRAADAARSPRDSRESGARF